MAVGDSNFASSGCGRELLLLSLMGATDCWLAQSGSPAISNWAINCKVWYWFLRKKSLDEPNRRLLELVNVPHIFQVFRWSYFGEYWRLAECLRGMKVCGLNSDNDRRLVSRASVSVWLVVAEKCQLTRVLQNVLMKIMKRWDALKAAIFRKQKVHTLFRKYFRQSPTMHLWRISKSRTAIQPTFL